MAKRKGFGSPVAEHRKRIGYAMKDARSFARHVRHFLKEGNCNRAMHSLLDLTMEVGSARSESQGMGKRTGRVKRARGGSLYGAYASLARKVVAQCAKK